MDPDEGTEGEWHVCANDDDSGVVMSFVHMGPSGVQTFTTAMLPENATGFAEAILTCAKELA